MKFRLLPPKLAGDLHTRLYFAGYILGIIKSRFRNKSLQDTFEEVYKSNFWRSDESRSGPGSDVTQTESMRRSLTTFLREYRIKSILDIPCGDWNWMKKMDLSGISYIGADVVPSLVEKNIYEHASMQVNFKWMDIRMSHLPTVDLILCRDCLVHFSTKDISSAITQILASGSKYLMVTSYEDCQYNFNITTGDWRPINLRIKPFDFPKPCVVINEGCTEGDGRYRDKCLLVYKIKDLQDIPRSLHINKLRSLLHVFTARKIR